MDVLYPFPPTFFETADLTKERRPGAGGNRDGEDLHESILGLD
jgi:hypothetical protein